MKNGTSSRLGGQSRKSAAPTGEKLRRKAAEQKTNWKRLRSITSRQIHARLVSDPEIHPTDDDFWKDAKLVLPRRKKIMTIRLDADLLDWLRTERGYQTRINAVLRAYMDAQRRRR